MLRSSRRRWVALVATALLVVALAVGSATAATPAQVGAWTAPFEEGGSAKPRCAVVSGRIVCKPVAVGSAALPNGHVLYMNGVESSENVQYAAVPEAAPESRNSLSRILDLTGGAPVFGVPSPETGTADNPNIRPESDPFGVLGVPGGPGDGLVGTVWGNLGGPPQNPTSPPDDVQANDGDLFCTDMVQLADGRILIAGGTDWYLEPYVADRESGAPMGIGVSELEGLRDSQIFDPATGRYTATQPMKHGRWYPGLVTLGDGKVFVASGVTKLIKSTQGSQVRGTETFNPATSTWTDNGPAAEISLPLFPRLHLMPNGKVFYAAVGQTFGPMGQAVDELTWMVQRLYDPVKKTWKATGVAPFGMIGGAPQVMLALSPPYDKATLLIPGGTLGPTPGSILATNLSWLVTVDKKGNVTNQRTGDLKNRRWYSSAVTLPTGEVFVTSGADHDEVVGPGTELPLRQPELYNPATGAWTAMVSSSRDRTYHNSAVLLADGRVLVGGHSPIWTGYGAHHDFIPGVTANNDKDPSFEVFSPPYLFKGARPKLTGVPSGVAWGSSFSISTPSAAGIKQVVLSRLPSSQHITDSDARTIRLPFSAGSGTLTATAPPNGNVAPPGYYYVFLINGSGVPSVARMVKIGSAGDATPSPAIYSSDDPPPPDASIGASPDPDSSYINQPPPLPFGGWIIGLVAAGAGIPAMRRRLDLENVS